MEQAKISSSQGTQAAHATRAKAPAQQGADTSGDAAAAGGFLALLAALDGASATLESASADGGAGAIALDPGQGVVDAAAMAAWHGLIDTTVPVAGTAGTRDGVVGMEALTAGALSIRGSTGRVGGSDLAVGGAPQGIVAETAQLDASGGLQEESAHGTVAGFGRIFSRIQSAQIQRAGSALGGDASLRPAIGGDSTQRLLATHDNAAVQAQWSSERPLTGAHAAIAAERGLGTSGGALEAALSSSLTDGAPAGIATVRAGDASGGGRAGEGHSGSGAWSNGEGGASPLEGSGAEGTLVFQEPGPVGAEEQLTEQVAYWINQKTQNAEMTLQRDGQPVEVSVSLSGNEAHVSFRSDQAQTRELLDQSMAQLRDLLRSEGLELSGMSVGTSVRDDAAGQNGDAKSSRNRSGVRQAQVQSSAPVDSASPLRGSGGSERAVDVFV